MGQQETSGQSVAEFCRRRELNPSSFYAWRRKLSAALSAHRSSRPATTTDPVFVSLPIADSVAREGFEVKLPNGFLVTVPPQFEASVLARLLQAVTSIEGGNA